MPNLPYAHGGPALRGKIRCSADDFKVEELLGFEPTGDGEHVFLTIRKRDTNTLWLAKELARFAGVTQRDVGYAGLKDRHAVTVQTLSVQLPGQEGPDWSALNMPGVELLAQTRHNRKLKTGALQGNRFELVLRDVQGDRARVQERLETISRAGVPNYFGEQRFGRDGSNVARAQAMFEGKRVDRKTRGLLLSAVRSHLFNEVLAQRVEHGSWQQALNGEVWALEGSRSWFVSNEAEDLAARLEAGDIHPTGPMWGRGELPSVGEVAALERSVAHAYTDLVEGLERAGLSQDRRALRLLPQGLEWEWQADDVLKLDFALPAGSYATTVLRELLDWS